MDPQEQVPAGTTSIVLRNLQPDTKYTVSVLPMYPAREGRRQSEDGKTCKLLRDKDFHQIYTGDINRLHVLLFSVPLSGVSGMKVTNPTITTLTVNWNPAGGNVQGYKVIYVPSDGGLEIVVRP